jgi:pimeloyl-ACP methyl ester carboxylesterase
MLIDLLHTLIRYRYRAAGFESATIPVERCRLHFYRSVHNHGAGHVLFLHGLGTSSSTWLNVLPNLRTSQSIIAVDLPGFGLSRIEGDKPYFNLNQHLSCLETAVDQLCPRPITLVGHSLGGWLAALLALRRPDKIRHLVLINPAGVFYPGVDNLGRLFSPTTTDDVRDLVNRLWYRYPWYFRPFGSAILTSLKQRHVDDFVASVRSSDFLNGRFRALTMPVELVWGDDDRVLSRETIEVLKREIPRMQIHHLERCGHVPQLERPKELVHILKSILEVQWR